MEIKKNPASFAIRQFRSQAQDENVVADVVFCAPLLPLRVEIKFQVDKFNFNHAMGWKASSSELSTDSLLAEWPSQKIYNFPFD